MSDDFERAVRFVLEHEGGYVNRADDCGGETKYGISRRAYPGLDIKNLTEQDAVDIYKRDYWNKAGCNEMPWPMCLVVLDTAVNLGASRAVEFAGESIGYEDLIFLRIEHYCNLGRPQFLGGWINRCLDLWKAAKYDEHPFS